MTSSIVGGICSIACGIAYGSRDHVWCFVGDMAATTGTFHEATRYASGHDLPVTFIVEDNGLSTNSPTRKVWGKEIVGNIERYSYVRSVPHVGVGKWVTF